MANNGRDVLCKPHNRNPFRPGRCLKQCVLFDREVMRFVFPKKHRSGPRRRVGAAIHSTLEELRPDKRRELAYLTVSGHRNIYDDYLAIENVVRRKVGCRAEKLADFPTREWVEHAGKICADSFACLAWKRWPLNHPITYDQLPLRMIYGCLMSFLKQPEQEALSLPVSRRGLLGLLRCRYYHIVKCPQLNRLSSKQEQHNCVSKQFLLLRQPEVRL